MNGMGEDFDVDAIDSDFIALKELASRIEVAPQNAGWYMHRAYLLGRGASIDEVFERPPRDYSKPFLSLINGGKKDSSLNINEVTE